MDIVIRKATAADKDFLIRAIIEAEKSGSDKISYCAIFSITEQQLRELLSNILDENVDGQELCIDNFLLAEVDGVPAAAMSTWIENKDGMSSNMIKSNLLMYLLDRNIILNAAPALSLMHGVNIDRTEKALQIECVYTDSKYRGMGSAKRLIDEHITQKKEEMAIDTVQVILLKNNAPALKAYTNAGFTIVQEQTNNDPAILKLLPGDTKILMERKLNN